MNLFCFLLVFSKMWPGNIAVIRCFDLPYIIRQIYKNEYIIHYKRARDLRDETFIELFQDEAKRFMGHFIDGTKTNSRKAENLVLLFLSNKHTHTLSLCIN